MTFAKTLFHFVSQLSCSHKSIGFYRYQLPSTVALFNWPGTGVASALLWPTGCVFDLQGKLPGSGFLSLGSAIGQISSPHITTYHQWCDTIPAFHRPGPVRPWPCPPGPGLYGSMAGALRPGTWCCEKPHGDIGDPVESLKLVMVRYIRCCCYVVCCLMFDVVMLFVVWCLMLLCCLLFDVWCCYVVCCLMFDVVMFRFMAQVFDACWNWASWPTLHGFEWRRNRLGGQTRHSADLHWGAGAELPTLGRRRARSTQRGWSSWSEAHGGYGGGHQKEQSGLSVSRLDVFFCCMFFFHLSCGFASHFRFFLAHFLHCF